MYKHAEEKMGGQVERKKQLFAVENLARIADSALAGIARQSGEGNGRMPLRARPVQKDVDWTISHCELRCGKYLYHMWICKVVFPLRQ